MVLKVVDLASSVLDVRSDFSISARELTPGKPQRVEGITIGYVESTHGFPHNGEVHPDGDEILILLSGCLRVSADNLDDDVIIKPGSACIVSKGEWHKVHVVEPSTFIYATPGPNGDHRDLSDEEMSAWQQKMSEGDA